MSQLISRREFLKLSGSTLALATLPPTPLTPDDIIAARGEIRLGRVTTWRAWVHSEPDPAAPHVDERRRDAVIRFLDEVEGVGHYSHNPVWYRMVDGYIYSSWVQPVEYRLNQPFTRIEPPGMLAWVTVPYTDVRARPDLSARSSYRLYYDAIFRVVEVQVHPKQPATPHMPRKLCADPLLEGEQILPAGCVIKSTRSDSAVGQVWYGLRDGLTWSGVNWAQGEHLRIIPPEELKPRSPEVEAKRILIELGKQWLTCLEGEDAVFETRLSSGLPGMVTPLGTHRVLRKTHTTRMTGGVGSNYYDLPGIGFVTYFTPKGVAIHGTYWHNDYGRRRSHGCVNTPTAAAQWIYRWCRPDVPYADQRILARADDATVIEVVY